MMHQKSLLHCMHPAGITPGVPVVASFNSRFEDGVLSMELFTSVQEAIKLAEQYLVYYDNERLYSCLQGLALWGLSVMDRGLINHQLSEYRDQKKWHVSVRPSGDGRLGGA